MTIKTRTGQYPDSFAKYLRPTNMCNFDYGPVRKVANQVTADATTEYQVLASAHEFVSTLRRGVVDERSYAHHILRAQQAHDNTKTTLFVSITRCAGVPTRIRAYLVKREELPHTSKFFPKEVLLLYPEVYYKGSWKLLCSALNNRSKPDWSQSPFDDVYGRKQPVKPDALIKSLGSFWHPDLVFESHSANTDGWRGKMLKLFK